MEKKLSHKKSGVSENPLPEELPLKKHKTIHTGEKCFKCRECGDCFPLTQQTEHNKVHAGQKPYSCIDCDQCFRFSFLLSIHRRKVHSDKEPPLSCCVCGKTLDVRCNVAIHKRSHPGQMIFACDTFGKRFQHKSGLLRHIETYADKVSHVDESSKPDETQGQMSESHNVNFVGVDPNGVLAVKEEVDPLGEFAAPEESDPAVESSVKEEFNPLGGLAEEEIDSLEIKEEFEIETKSTTHKKSGVSESPLPEELTLKKQKTIHAGEKSFKCRECGERFPLTQETEHKKVHAGQKPYSCTDCDKCFRFSFLLSIHRRKVHSDKEPQLSCCVCGKTLDVRCNVAIHKRSHPGQMIFACDNCGKRFQHKSGLLRHIETCADKVSHVDESSKPDEKQGQMSESHNVNFVGVDPNGVLAVKEEVDPLGELAATEESGPAVESSVKEEFNPLEGLIKEEIDSLEIKEEMISSEDETSSNL